MDRYWVGGSGSWNSTTKWSTTSGGASGASVPTASDNAIFDANSGTAHFTVTVTLNATCADLTITPEPIAGVTQFAVDNGFVITGTFSTSGTAGNQRVWFRSSTYGLMRDISIAAVGSISDVDFRDIRVIGTAAPISGTRIGDLRGCRGITFDAPKTVYWNLAGAQNWSANGWSDTSTGTPSTDFFPLAQDIATFTNAGSVTGTITMDAAVPYTGTVDMSGRTSAMTLGGSTAYAVYGNWVLGSGVTQSYSGALTFSGRNTQTITSAGKTLSGGITVDSYGGTVELADAFATSGTITVTNGTFDTKNYNVTAGSLSSFNTNVRTVNLGSSTVTLSASTVISFGSTSDPVSPFLTFNAGTSTIVCSSTSNNIDIRGGVTFYNVTSVAKTVANRTFIVYGNNAVFNNLTVLPSTVSGTHIIIFAPVPSSPENNTVTVQGTLTCEGSSQINRMAVRPNNAQIHNIKTLLYVNTLIASNCDFQSIQLMGAASPATLSGAGNLGNNDNIVFPLPKTVYWNLTGSTTWFSNGWAATSGGSPALANFPLAQDTAVFDDSGAAGTVTYSAPIWVGTLDMSARSTAMTFTFGSTFNVCKDLKLSSAVSYAGSSSINIMSAESVNYISFNGAAVSSNVDINNVLSKIELLSAISTTGSFRVLVGAFDAKTYNITANTCNVSSGTATYPLTLKMGSGTWTLSGTGTIWNATAATSFNFYKETANILLSSTSTSARTFGGGALSYNKLTIGGTTGTSTTTIDGNNQFTELASTKTVAHTIALGSTTQTFGAWTVTGTVGNVVTLTGTGTAHILAGACTSSIDYLAMGSIGFAATSPGEFYAGANSTGTAAAPVYRTDKPADSTRYWVGGTGNWSDTARWSDSSGGASGFSVPRSHDDVVFDSLSNATAYTATVNAVTGGIRTKALTIAGPLVGNVTLAGSTAINGIHGDVTLPATGLTRTYTGAITLSGSATGRTLTTNGVTLGSVITVDGVGCGWSLGTALNSTANFIVNNGSFATANYSLATTLLRSASAHSRTVDLGSSVVSISGNSQLDFGTTETARAAFSLISGTSQINISGITFTFNGNNQNFYNISLTGTIIGAIGIDGVNTFNNFSVAGQTSAGVGAINLFANQTINGTLTLSAGTNATMRMFVRSVPLGTTRTLTCAAFSGTDADFRDITIAGAAAPVSGTRLGDCKGNSGITFDAAKTVYWRTAGASNWSASGNGNWSFTDGGSADATAFPLAQDTAMFVTYPTTAGSTITVDAGWNIGTIDMSARTSNTMTLSCAQNPSIYGSWVNGTGTTLDRTGTLTFAGRGSQTITSAGRTFTQAFTISTPSGSVSLGDAFTSSASGSTPFDLSNGTFSAAGYNFTLSNASSRFTSSNTNTRTVDIGSGTWTLAGVSSAISWSCGTSTNLTVTGTGTISLTNASAKTFAGGGISYSGITLNQGGAGTLTITGNNTFANISNSYSATGATNITLGTTTQTVGNFTASGEAGRVLTVQGTSASSPATLIYTGSGQAAQPAIDYLTITGVRAYSLDTTWYAGANSTNNGSLGWYFEAGGGGPIAVFIIESATADSSESSLATLNIGVSETTTAADAAAAGFICLGTLSESATVSDAVEAFRAFLASVAESATSSELVSAALTLSATISELTTGSDETAVTSRVTNPTIAETAQMVDAIAAGLLYLSDISEATTAQEIATAVLIFNRAVSEAATASEVLAAVAAFNAVVPEQVSGADVANALITVGGAINEALTALDSVVNANTTRPNIAESATASESSTNVYTANPVIAETATPLDATQVVASTFSASSAETATPLDAVQGANTGSSSLSESATASEAQAAQFTAATTISEATTAQETAAAIQLFVTQVAEAAIPADTTSVAPSTFGAIALAAAQAAESFSPAGSVYNAALPVESAGITDFLVGAYLWNPIDDTQDPNWQNVNNAQSVTWTEVSNTQNPGWVVIPTAND